jgi:hypothetical protein
MSITYEYSAAVTAAILIFLAAGSILLVLKPKRIVLLYITPLLLFTGTMYGLSSAGSGLSATTFTYTLYGRGAGQLPMSFLNIYLVVLFLFTAVTARTQFRKPMPGDPILPFLIFLALAFLAYASVGLVSGITFSNAISRFGMINFLNLLFMYLVIKWSITEERDLLIFHKLLLWACGLMAVYGLVRYLGFGGDPANYYNAFEQSGVRLSYFDIGQSALFCTAMVSVLLTLKDRQSRSIWHLMFALLFLANILLSYRRNAWAGLMIVLVWFFLISDMKWKPLLTGIAVVGVIIMSTLSQARFGDTVAHDFTNRKGEVQVKKGRFSELYQGVQATSRSPLVGLGPWGVNKGFRRGPGEDVGFVHSSIVHAYLKMGFLGLVPYVLMLVSFPIWWFRKRKQQWNDPRKRDLGEAFFCGFLFWLPDIFFGTPTIVFRHFQILAMILAIPVVAYGIDRAQGETGEKGQIAGASGTVNAGPIGGGV